MRRRLFEGLQQGIERLLREHVHLIDDVNLIMTLRRRVAHVVAQLAHIINAPVAYSVDLDHIETVACGDLLAVIAFSARRDRRTLDAIERLGQNSPSRSLADATRPNKQVRMSKPILFDCIFQSARDMRLSHEIIKSLRPIFPCENLVTHMLNLTAPAPP